MHVFLIGYYPWSTIGGPQDPDGCKPEPDHAGSYPVRLGPWWCSWFLPRPYSLGVYDIHRLVHIHRLLIFPYLGLDRGINQRRCFTVYCLGD